MHGEEGLRGSWVSLIKCSSPSKKLMPASKSQALLNMSSTSLRNQLDSLQLGPSIPLRLLYKETCTDGARHGWVSLAAESRNWCELRSWSSKLSSARMGIQAVQSKTWSRLSLLFSAQQATGTRQPSLTKGSSSCLGLTTTGNWELGTRRRGGTLKKSRGISSALNSLASQRWAALIMAPSPSMNSGGPTLGEKGS